MFGESPTDIFAIRCYFDSHPIRLIFLMYGFCLCFYAYSLRLFERVFNIPPIETSKSTQIYPPFDSIWNGIWCVFVTMMTVGYGDYFPITYLGRSVVFLAAFSGVILTSLITVAFFKSLEFTASENKVYILLERLRIREEINSMNKEIIKLLMHKYVVQFKLKKETDLFEKERLQKNLHDIDSSMQNYLKKSIQIKK